VFDESNGDPTTQQTMADGVTTPDTSKQMGGEAFNTLVGDGKKFKSVEDLAKSKLEADSFIERLKGEQADLRKELQEHLKEKETLNALKVATRGNQPEHNEEDRQQSKADMVSIVKDTLTQVEAEKIAIENVRTANNYLIEKLGGKSEAEQYLLKKSEELGIPMDWFKDMAARSPKALYNTLGVEAPIVTKPNTGITKGDVNTLAREMINPSSPGLKAKYDVLRREKPSEYWTPKVQQEIFDLAKKGQYK